MASLRLTLQTRRPKLSLELSHMVANQATRRRTPHVKRVTNDGAYFRASSSESLQTTNWSSSAS
jgi:hypothetical protein